ncbi:MAG: haloacid dehalogenase type II [Actinobacteria bacterium]|nr:haloacid dehalogenase type II [Actinomycetota bacterium]
MDIEVVAFDVFGTLVDWHTSIAEALARVGGRAGIEADWPRVASAWRELYHPTLNRVVEGGLPFQPLDVLHRMMLDQVAEEQGLGALTDADRAELVRAWHRLAPWPDSGPGLTALRERHLLSPLSNGGLGLLTRLARFAGLPFDCIVSAELARSYKPDPRVYQLIPGYFDIRPEQVLMVACHPEDLVAASGQGLRTGYIPRPAEWGPGGTAPAPPAGADFAGGDLVELAALVAAAERR